MRSSADVDMYHNRLPCALSHLDDSAARTTEFIRWRNVPSRFVVRRVRGVRSTTRGGRLKVASEPILAALDVAVVDRTGSAPNVLSDYWMLTKPEVNLLIGITTGSALWIGAPLLPRGCVPEYAVWHAASSERSRDHSSTDRMPLSYKDAPHAAAVCHRENPAVIREQTGGKSNLINVAGGKRIYLQSTTSSLEACSQWRC
jgi:hypothetical protein